MALNYELTVNFKDPNALRTLTKGSYSLKVALAHDPSTFYHPSHASIAEKRVEDSSLISKTLLVLLFSAYAPNDPPDYWITYKLPGGNPLQSALRKIKLGQSYTVDFVNNTGTINTAPGDWVKSDQFGFVNTKAATPVIYRKPPLLSETTNPTPDVNNDKPLSGGVPIFAPGSGVLHLPKPTNVLVAWFENKRDVDAYDDDSIGYGDQTKEKTIKWRTDASQIRKATLELDADFNLTP